MALYDIPNSSDGMDTFLVGTVSQIPTFTPMLLMFVYFFVLITGTISQRRREGEADFPMWAALAGLSTTMIALLLTMTTGLIDVLTLSVTITITVFSGVWFFLSKS